TSERYDSTRTMSLLPSMATTTQPWAAPSSSPATTAASIWQPDQHVARGRQELGRCLIVNVAYRCGIQHDHQVIGGFPRMRPTRKHLPHFLRHLLDRGGGSHSSYGIAASLSIRRLQFGQRKNARSKIGIAWTNMRLMGCVT